MLHQALIITSQREYAQAMRQALLKLGDDQTRIDVELDSLRATQLSPQPYELVLIDAMLDGMDGLQLLLFIKQQAPANKFVIVGDSGNESQRAAAYQNGADFFVERPAVAEGYPLAADAIKEIFTPGASGQPTEDNSDGAMVNMVDIVQMHCLSGDSVLLVAKSQDQSGDIFIYRGEVYHAQYPGNSGEPAFRDMLLWDGGRVRIKAVKLAHSPPRTIEVPYRQLLQNKEKPETPAKDAGLIDVPTESATGTAALSVVKEAPPREDVGPIFFPNVKPAVGGDTPLPRLNSHWMVNLSGDLMEGSQVAEPDRCAFITSFIYRKMADVAVALEVDYFDNMTLLGPHLQQVLMANNMGVRHAVFDTAWTTEEMRVQYVKWCCEQSF